MGFDKTYFAEQINYLAGKHLPEKRQESALYQDLNDLIEKDVDIHFYMSSGYLETLKKHKARHKEKGNGFGYMLVNEIGIKNPIANALLATGGSGKDRNLIYSPKEGIGGTCIKGKKTPLNVEGIRYMTPTEWGKLQGFINYAFLNEDGVDRFSFPNNLSNTQKYKQFGNSVTIPVIEQMALFMKEAIEQMEQDIIV